MEAYFYLGVSHVIAILHECVALFIAIAEFLVTFFSRNYVRFINNKNCTNIKAAMQDKISFRTRVELKNCPRPIHSKNFSAINDRIAFLASGEHCCLTVWKIAAHVYCLRQERRNERPVVTLM